MSTTPKKLRLYDRLINKLIPLHQSELDVLNQEQAMYAEQERFFKAEADRVVMENKAKAAAVALQEEANARERERLNREVIVARAEYEFKSRIRNVWTEVTAILSLTESKVERGITIMLVDSKTKAPVGTNEEVEQFVRAQSSFDLWLRPWIEGTLELKILKNMEADSCFKRIFLVGK